MKKLLLVLLAVAVLSSNGIILSSLVQAGEAKGAHVVVYYLHGTFRCPTCHKLEQYSRKL